MLQSNALQVSDLLNSNITKQETINKINALVCKLEGLENRILTLGYGYHYSDNSNGRLISIISSLGTDNDEIKKLGNKLAKAASSQNLRKAKAAFLAMNPSTLDEGEIKGIMLNALYFVDNEAEQSTVLRSIELILQKP